MSVTVFGEYLVVILIKYSMAATVMGKTLQLSLLQGVVYSYHYYGGYLALMVTGKSMSVTFMGKDLQLSLLFYYYREWFIASVLQLSLLWGKFVIVMD